MKKNPLSVENMLAAKALEMMNTNRITSLCVHRGKQKEHWNYSNNILNANISNVSKITNQVIILLLF